MLTLDIAKVLLLSKQKFSLGTLVILLCVKKRMLSNHLLIRPFLFHFVTLPFYRWSGQVFVVISFSITYVVIHFCGWIEFFCTIYFEIVLIMSTYLFCFSSCAIISFSFCGIEQFIAFLCYSPTSISQFNYLCLLFLRTRFVQP